MSVRDIEVFTSILLAVSPLGVEAFFFPMWRPHIVTTTGGHLHHANVKSRMTMCLITR